MKPEIQNDRREQKKEHVFDDMRPQALALMCSDPPEFAQSSFLDDFDIPCLKINSQVESGIDDLALLWPDFARFIRATNW